MKPQRRYSAKYRRVVAVGFATGPRKWDRGPKFSEVGGRLWALIEAHYDRKTPFYAEIRRAAKSAVRRYGKGGKWFTASPRPLRDLMERILIEKVASTRDEDMGGLLYCLATTSLSTISDSEWTQITRRVLALEGVQSLVLYHD